MSPLEGPYMIRATPDSGYQETVVMEPAAEALKALIDWTNHEVLHVERLHQFRVTFHAHQIKSRNAEVEPDADHHVQARQLMCRVYCALFMSRKLIVARGPRFYGQMNPKLLHDAIQVLIAFPMALCVIQTHKFHTQMPFERKQLAILCGLFADLNRSKTGLLTVIEFSEFFKQDYPQVVSALFFRFIFELTIRQSPLGACCEEFCIIINHLALMNESELLRLVFNCLANSTDAQKEKYCDMAGLKERYDQDNSAATSRATVSMINCTCFRDD